MNILLSEVALPVRLQPAVPLTDEEMLRFCAANGNLRIEREAGGTLIVMTPAGNRTGRRNAYLIQALGAWADENRRGYAFDSNTGFSLADGSMCSPDAAWVSATGGMRSRRRSRTASRIFARSS